MNTHITTEVPACGIQHRMTAKDFQDGTEWPPGVTAGCGVIVFDSLRVKGGRFVGVCHRRRSPTDTFGFGPVASMEIDD